MFTHLNVHSHYSRMSGTASQPALLTAARNQGMRHLALTETNGLWGFIRFVQHARAAEIEPIAGVNLVTGQDEAILLAEDQGGYENMSRAVSAVHDDSTQSITDILQGRSAGLFVLAHERSTLSHLSKLISSSHLFVELCPGVTERIAQKLSREFKLETVATGDVYFIHKEEWSTHHTLRAIDLNTTLSKLPKGACKSDKHWFHAEKDMIQLFPNSMDAINNSTYLAERCKRDWTFLDTIFPNLSLKDTRRANQKLKEKVKSGAQKRYGKVTSAIQDRIDYELRIITSKGFAPYFLVVEDIVKQTRATIGRGSGAASIVSYCLFITQVDPIKYNLQFERFIHPERNNMPDIDVDFPWDERDDILDYVFKKYGNERTAMVCSQVFMKPRSAIREVAKVYGLSNEEIKTITKRIGWYASRRDLLNWVKTDRRFENIELDDTLEEILRESEKVVGAFRHPSVHPGGVVIVPDEIRKYVPVLTAPKGVQIVEWEKDQVEDSGLLKIDILGNRSLAVVRDTVRQINLNYGEAASRNSYLNYHKIQPIGDKKTERLMQSGKTMGIFYIESPATRQLLAKAGVVDFEHVVIYSSIIRPAANRFTNIMLERIHGEPWKILHPDLNFLKESYGIMVYEEQVSMAAMVMAGMGYAEAELLRKTMSRDSMQHLIRRWEKKFYQGAKKRGYTNGLIKEVWDMIRSFVGYSFCKPHSASFAMLSFTCAYLKAHFPAEFLAAVISNQGGFYSPFAYLSEARRFGIKILPPDVNRSWLEYRGRKDRIRMGFMSIRNLQGKTVKEILDERKAGYFTSLEDFFMRVDPPLSDAMALTNAGCFYSLAPQLPHREIAYRAAWHCLGEKQNNNVTLSQPVLSKSEGKHNIVQIATRRQGQGDRLSEEDRRRLEIESFGFPISEHPLEPYLPMINDRVRKAADLPKYIGRTIHLAGVYITRKETATVESKDPMEFLTLEDETDIYECVLFPEAFRKYGDLLLWENLFLLRGKVEESFGVISVTIEKLGSLPKMFRLSRPKNSVGI
ncbi:MAG: DNA polymerase III subunit alpha [Candidatus Marinimicrobia bacterium]|nr:DNA polymerase III subunit alpha [Candidatus Neomarinimicrobiota bacterium]